MNNDMANTHGDLLVKSVHKNNSLDHLMRGTGSRPPSAQRPRSSASSTGRPRSRAQSAAPTRQATPLSRQAPTNRTSSAQPSWRTSLEKTELQKRIDGDTGPAMIGVSTYPYSRTQSSYREDFEQLVASTITHPYISTTNMGQGSCPHNLLTGAPDLPDPPPKRTALTRRAGADWEQVPTSRPRSTTGTATTSATLRSSATRKRSTHKAA